MYTPHLQSSFARFVSRFLIISLVFYPLHGLAETKTKYKSDQHAQRILALENQLQQLIEEQRTSNELMQQQLIQTMGLLVANNEDLAKQTEASTKKAIEEAEKAEQNDPEHTNFGLE